MADAGAAVPREVAVRRLLALDATGRLGTADVELVARGLGVSPRTVWRWLERARQTGQTARAERDRLVVTEPLLERLAFWLGNLAAVHRELVAAGAAGGPAAPSFATLHRRPQQ